MTRASVDEADWEQPLGAELPAPGYPRVRWWWVVGCGVLLLACLVGLGVALRPILFPPVALALELERHASVRQGALAWRARYAVDPRAAGALELWSADDAGYALVQPLAPTDERARARGATQPIFRPARERWSLSLQQLTESLQAQRLGEEQLSRGAILVALAGESLEATPRVVASALSPLGGHERSAAPPLVPYAHCLPSLEPSLAEAQLTTPMNPAANGETVYWLLREAERVTVIATDACRGEKLAVRQARAATVAHDSVVLLSFDPNVDKGPFVLSVPSSGAGDATLQVFKFLGTDAQRLERQPMERGAERPLVGSTLYDSFEQGLGGAPDQRRTVARRLLEGKVEHLVWRGKAWGFAECPEPDEDRYQVAYSNCEGLKDTFVRLGPQHEREAASEGGWNVYDWSKEGDESCAVRVVPRECGAP